MAIEERSMDEVLQKASVLIEALPYIQRFNRKIIVVKYGGSAMVDDSLKRSVIEDVTLLKLVGFKPIIVHGGGKEISRWVEKSGMEPQFINGLRVTDEPTMEIAEMVLNKVNKSLVQLVEQLGVLAVGVSGKDGGMLKVEKSMQTAKISGLSVISKKSIQRSYTICWKKISFQLLPRSAWTIITTLTILMQMTPPVRLQGLSVRKSWRF